MVILFMIRFTSFQYKLESIQCNAALALTEAIGGSARDKFYQELGLEPLQLRRWKLCCFFFKKFVINSS